MVTVTLKQRSIHMWLDLRPVSFYSLQCLLFLVNTALYMTCLHDMFTVFTYVYHVYCVYYVYCVYHVYCHINMVNTVNTDKHRLCLFEFTVTVNMVNTVNIVKTVLLCLSVFTCVYLFSPVFTMFTMFTIFTCVYCVYCVSPVCGLI